MDFKLVSDFQPTGDQPEAIKELVDAKINLYMQKEKITLLDDNGEPSIFAPIMLATLSTCAQLERENITFRLNSGAMAITHSMISAACISYVFHSFDFKKK